jgi:hypothetical protein
MRIPSVIALIIGLVVALGVTACGGGGDTTTVITQQTVTEETSTSDGGSPSSSDGGSPSSSDNGSEEVPDLVGERLDVAEDELDGMGINYEEIGGGTFGIVVRSNWEVCETRPKAGSSASTVKLIVDRPGNC